MRGSREDGLAEASAEAGRPTSPLEQTLAVLWKRRRAFSAFFLTTLAAVAVVTFLLPNIYSTTAFILVEPARSAGSDFAAVETTNTLAKTYSELLQSPSTASRVSETLEYDLSEDELFDSIKVSPVSDTQLLAVEAEGSTPERARVLANTYAAVFVDRVTEIGSEISSPAQLTVGEFSSLPSSPSRPKPRLYLLIGAILAAALATGAVLLRERLAQRLEIDPSTTRLFGQPVIGRIPVARGAPTAFGEPDSVAARVFGEPFRLLHTNLSFVTVNRPLSIAVMSAESGEGKSVCASHLALIAAEFGESALLVDADLRLGTLSQRLAGDATKGLSSLLAGGSELTGILPLTVQVPGTGLRFLPAGRLPPNPGVLLGSDALWRFDSHARAEFDLVIYDCPPLSIGADASLIASQAGGVLVIIDAERTRRKAALQALDQIRRASAEIFGVVLNRAPGASAAYGYYYQEAIEALGREGDDQRDRHANDIDGGPLPQRHPSPRVLSARDRD